MASPVASSPPVATPLAASATSAPSASSAPPPGADTPAAATAGSQNPIARVFSEVDALLTRLQLALSVQKYSDRPSASEADPLLVRSAQGSANAGGASVFSASGAPLLTSDGVPVSLGKFEAAPAAPTGAAADDPVTAAFRAMGEFLRRLLGGEAGTKPAE